MLRRIPVADLVIAALFALVAAIECTFLVDFGPRWPYVLNAAIHLGLVPAMLLRRVRPVASCVAAYALLAALGVLVNVSPVNLGVSPALFAAPLAVLAVTRHGPSPRWGQAAVLLGVVGAFASPAVHLGVRGLGVAAHVVLLLGCYLWAAQQRQLADRHARDLAEQARARDERAARAAEAERAMIAREVHDIVAHNLAVVRVQAATALALGGEDRLRAALQAIKDVTGDALGETRELVGSLRSSDPAGPSGDLGTLPGLVTRARESLPELAAELPDAVVLDTWQATWPARTRLTVLRVAQESLTNLIKHGSGAASFAVTQADGRVVVEAHNTARRASGVPGGHGLVGVRERVELAGGTLRAAPEGEGFRVRAEVPLGCRPGPADREEIHP